MKFIYGRNSLRRRRLWFMSVRARPNSSSGDTWDECQQSSGFWRESCGVVSRPFSPTSLYPPPSTRPPLCATLRWDEWTLSCHAKLCTSLSSIRGPLEECFRGKQREKNVYFEHFLLPILTSPPPAHTLCRWVRANVCRGWAAAHKHTVRRSKPDAADVKLWSGPLLLQHAVNKHTELPLPLCVGGGASLCFQAFSE